MSGFQQVVIEGRLGRDPEMRFTANGKAVTTFSVAVDDGYGDRKETEWFQVVTWEKTAEACGQYLEKGREVLVSGRMKTRTFNGRDGQKQYRTELIAQRVEFIGGQRGAGDIDPRDLPFPGGEGDIDPEDLPFED